MLRLIISPTSPCMDYPRLYPRSAGCSILVKITSFFSWIKLMTLPAWWNKKIFPTPFKEISICWAERKNHYCSSREIVRGHPCNYTTAFPQILHSLASCILKKTSYQNQLVLLCFWLHGYQPHWRQGDFPYSISPDNKCAARASKAQTTTS